LVEVDFLRDLGVAREGVHDNHVALGVSEYERLKNTFVIDNALLKHAKSHMVVMHPLPRNGIPGGSKQPVGRSRLPQRSRRCEGGGA
jgi:hypothetical protein